MNTFGLLFWNLYLSIKEQTTLRIQCDSKLEFVCKGNKRITQKNGDSYGRLLCAGAVYLHLSQIDHMTASAEMLAIEMACMQHQFAYLCGSSVTAFWIVYIAPLCEEKEDEPNSGVQRCKCSI